MKKLDGYSHWGECKEDLLDGYVRAEGADKSTVIGQYKQGKSYGYAVFK